MKISFLASHGGSSAKAIIAAMAGGELDAEPGILITNNVPSGIFQWCKDHDFPVQHISTKTHADEDAAILAALQEAETDIVVCSGYMKKVGANTLQGFEGKILNIHPSLLPKHGGKGLYGDRVHAAVLAAVENESGATVHVVTEGYDEGPILGQSKVSVTHDDTLETLRGKVQATEPGLYISCLKSFLTHL